MNRSNRFLVAAPVVAVALCLPASLSAMPLRQFDAMNKMDQAEYIAVIVNTTQRVLRVSGGANYAAQFEQLFVIKPGDTISDGLAELELNIIRARVADANLPNPPLPRLLLRRLPLLSLPLLSLPRHHLLPLRLPLRRPARLPMIPVEAVASSRLPRPSTPCCACRRILPAIANGATPQAGARWTPSNIRWGVTSTQWQNRAGSTGSCQDNTRGSIQRPLRAAPNLFRRFHPTVGALTSSIPSVHQVTRLSG